LAAAKLNPVTEQEFATIMETFASARRDPEANLGALEAQLNWLTYKMKDAQAQQDHYRKNGTMEGFIKGFEFRLPKPRGKGAGGGGEKIEIEGVD
jgi:hypothetical protein